MRDYTLSNSEATILGITEAGWFKLIENAGERYNTTHGWSSSLLRKNESSVYQLYLNAKNLNSLLSLKYQFESTIQQELEHTTREIIPLLQKFLPQLNCTLWIFYCEIKGERVDMESIEAYFSNSTHNLVTLCKKKGINIEDLLTALIMKKPDLVSSLNYKSHVNLLLLLKQFHKQLMMGFDQLKSSPTKKDHNLDASKRIIIDTIQENIMRYYEGKELIPIEMVIIKHEKDVGFYPDLSTVIHKKDKHYSSAELRMVYKLMEEIPDQEIRDIVRVSFFLKEMITDGVNKEIFKTIENPWDSHELVGGGTFWQKRERKSGAESYRDRAKESLPQWVQGLIETKEQYEKKASYNIK